MWCYRWSNDKFAVAAFAAGLRPLTLCWRLALFVFPGITYMDDLCVCCLIVKASHSHSILLLSSDLSTQLSWWHLLSWNSLYLLARSSFNSWCHGLCSHYLKASFADTSQQSLICCWAWVSPTLVGDVIYRFWIFNINYMFWLLSDRLF